MLRPLVPLTSVIGHRVREGKGSAFRERRKPVRFQGLRDARRGGTGVRIVSTSFEVEPSSHEVAEYDTWDPWELPDCSTSDGYVGSQPRRRSFQEALAPFVRNSYRWITTPRTECPG